MRPSTIIIVVIMFMACAAGAWLVMGPRSTSSSQTEASRASGLFKAPQDYKTSGGQQMKPRW